MAQVLVVDRKDLAAAVQSTGKRRARPLTAVQERLFLGVAFGLALLIQIAVVWMPMLAGR